MNRTYSINRQYMMHSGVKGMHWGIRKSPEASAARAQKKAANKAFKEFTKTKSPKKFGIINTANSAARDYYKMNSTNSFKKAQKYNERMNRKMNQLTKEQIDAGRYRVARSLSRRNTVAGIVTGSAVAAGMSAVGLRVTGMKVAGTIAATGYASGQKYRNDMESYKLKYAKAK